MPSARLMVRLMPQEYDVTPVLPLWTRWIFGVSGKVKPMNDLKDQKMKYAIESVKSVRQKALPGSVFRGVAGIESLTRAQAEALLYDWNEWVRENQRPAGGSRNSFVIPKGRATGRSSRICTFSCAAPISWFTNMKFHASTPSPGVRCVVSPDRRTTGRLWRVCPAGHLHVGSICNIMIDPKTRASMRLQAAQFGRSQVCRSRCP